MAKLKITETVLRDAHQSLLATKNVYGRNASYPLRDGQDRLLLR